MKFSFKRAVNWASIETHQISPHYGTEGLKRALNWAFIETPQILPHYGIEGFKRALNRASIMPLLPSPELTDLQMESETPEPSHSPGHHADRYCIILVKSTGI